MIESRSCIETGRAYAQAGYRVLPLYGLRYDTETGELVCQCKLGEDCTRSPGKHPHTLVASRGVHDATADVSSVDKWPEFCNIGLVPTPTVAGIDIDDEELAAKILGMPDAEKMTMVKTRNGLHIYIRCAPSQTQNLKAEDDGRHIGEIRVDNAYLVLPPSRHPEGYYEWVGPSLLDNQMEDANGRTAFEWIRDLVALHGVKLSDRTDPEMFSVAPDDMEDCDLPFEVDPNVNLKLYQLLSGTYPTQDRSGILFLMGCEIWRVAYEKNVVLDPVVVAGVMRKTDAIAWNKYSGRTVNRDRRYWEVALKTKAAVDAEIAANGSSPSATTQLRTWSWDPVAGFVFQGGQNPKRICNFEPLIVEVQTVVGEQGDLRSDWILRFTNMDGEVFEHTLVDKERGDFKKSMATILPPTFIVGAREWSNLEEGMRWYSKDTMRTRRVYGETGWLPDRDAFLLPALGGAITADGIDRTVEIKSDNMPPTLTMYGIGMRKPEENFDIEGALRVLYNIASPEVIVPLMTQVIASPLASLDTSHTATIVHMLSRTGSYKTSIAKIVISLYGAFEKGITPETWTSTPNSLQVAMHEYRDLPMIIDDYKRSLGRSHLTQMIALIQNYSDRTTRGRLGRDQRSLRRVVPRCLAISTGEDVWEGQESIMARTLILDASRNPTHRNRLGPAQDLAKDGRFAHIGYLWLEWLCAIGKERLATTFQGKYVEKVRLLEEQGPAIYHARSHSALASMLVVDSLWDAFLMAKAPGFVNEYRAMRGLGWKTLLADIAAQTEDATSYSPYETLRDAVRTGLSAGTAYLAPRLRSVTGIGIQSAAVVGYIDNEFVYLSQDLTLGWYQEHESRKGGDHTVSWISFVQEGRQRHGMQGNVPTHVNHNNAPFTLRFAKVARSEFLGAIDQTAGDEQAHDEDDSAMDDVL